MIRSGHAYDFAMKLNHIMDYKTHSVDIDEIKSILQNGEMDIIDYLENDYGHFVDFSLFDKETRKEITEFCYGCVISIDIERKWGVKKDGIGLLLACAIYLLWYVMNDLNNWHKSQFLKNSQSQVSYIK